MRANHYRAMAITAVAPIAWGSVYFVTRHALPAGHPLFGAAVRALPAGVILFALTRKLPTGSWWWRTAVISLLTVGGFFVLVYLAGQRLPSGVAATLMATSPAFTMALAWPLLAERPRLATVTGAVLGGIGVIALVGAALGGLDPLGVAASLAAMASSALGYVLTKRWQPPVGPATFVGWQLLMGGIVLLPLAFAIEGPPPPLSGENLAGFAYITLVGTAIANVCWFTGLKRLSATTVGIIGLLNPLVGTLLGMGIASETLAPMQWAGVALILFSILVGIQPANTATRTIAATGAAPLAAAGAIAATNAEPTDQPTVTLRGAEPRQPR